MKKKTNPIGIRFNEVKSELIVKKEKLKSKQHLVDFLLDFYLEQQFEDRIKETMANTTVKKIGDIREGAEASKIQRKTETKVTPAPQKESNQSPKNGFATLDQLKASCPPELTGLDRSVWISEQRVKYGI